VGQTATVVSVQYTVGDTTKTVNYSLTQPTSILYIQYPDSILEAVKNSTGALEIQAVVSVTYPDDAGLYDQFTERTDSSSSDGITVRARAILSYQQDTLRTSSMRTAQLESESRRHYRLNMDLAVLNYNALSVDSGDGTGDNSYLGINPNDEQDNDSVVWSNGYYNPSALPGLTSARHIRYTLKLYQKNASGVYEQVTDPEHYLETMNVDSSTITPQNGTYVVTADWSVGEGYKQGDIVETHVPIRFRVITGADFEASGLTYANYKVELTAELLDEKNQVLDGSTASDYIIYTNARILTGVVTTGS
jgi:hypothetical protein